VGATLAPVTAEGVIDLDALADVLTDEVTLVSVMLAGNEVGVIQPVPEIASLVRELAPRAVVHTDAVQAVGWLDVSALCASADLISVSAHKFGGPPGVGALVIRRDTPFTPVFHGGSQERDRRPGTQNLPGAAAMGVALASATAERSVQVARVAALRDRLVDGLLDHLDGVRETGASREPEGGDRRHLLPGIGHLCFAGIDHQELLVLMDAAGVCTSAGSACASGALEPSHVLLAMGLTPTEARGAVRFSLGHTTTPAEVDYALDVIPDLVRRLRS
jgi:cysteine desulfurase